MPTLPGLLPLLSHATAAAGGALGADRNPALWPVTVPPHISRTRVQPAGSEKREMSTLTATASLSEQEARGIVDAMPQTIVVLSPDGAALYANRSVLAYTGLTIDEMMAADFRTRVFHPEDVARLLDQRRDGLARGVPFELEQRARRHDGQYRWFLVQYNPVRDEQRRTVRWYATGTDIDDRKRAEERTRNENLALREEIDRASMFEEIIGSSPAEQRVHPGELPGHSGVAHRLRAVRPRKGSVHRRAPAATRAVRGRGRRHDLPGRNRGAPPRDPDRTAARASGTGDRTAGEQSSDYRRCACRRRHEPRSRCRGGARHVPGGSVLSVERLSHPDPAPARAPGRHSSPGGIPDRALRQAGREEHPHHQTADVGAVASVRLARERARAAERDRARRDPVRGRDLCHR